MAADCLRLLIILLEATNTSNQLGTKFNDWKCFFVRFKHRMLFKIKIVFACISICVGL